MNNQQIALFPTTKTKLLTCRLTSDDMAKLNAIAQFYNINVSQVLRRFINSEYDNINGHPELKQAIDKMQELTDFLAKFNQ